MGLVDGRHHEILPCLNSVFFFIKISISVSSNQKIEYDYIYQDQTNIIIPQTEVLLKQHIKPNLKYNQKNQGRNHRNIQEYGRCSNQYLQDMYGDLYITYCCQSNTFQKYTLVEVQTFQTLFQLKMGKHLNQMPDGVNKRRSTSRGR
ncbi:unnamed protein product [Paramecium octaurelia]|uniref:Uncharacterized protein n=1 Tax=Paramecium octaurelia TaxID=43137 RepID=A0A8S1XLW0_PAROT|nr:unnamed protein product [Paramecium octaurelia]